MTTTWSSAGATEPQPCITVTPNHKVRESFETQQWINMRSHQRSPDLKLHTLRLSGTTESTHTRDLKTSLTTEIISDNEHLHLAMRDSAEK
jgi:hypothetical protein